jgi:hypothetical protein
MLRIMFSQNLGLLWKGTVALSISACIYSMAAVQPAQIHQPEELSSYLPFARPERVLALFFKRTQGYVSLLSSCTKNTQSPLLTASQAFRAPEECGEFLPRDSSFVLVAARRKGHRIAQDKGKEPEESYPHVIAESVCE